MGIGGYSAMMPHIQISVRFPMTFFKPVLLATIATCAVAGAAQAADVIVPVPVVPVAIVEPAVFDWSGFYLGLGAGGSWQSYTFDGADFGTDDFVVDPWLYSGEIVLGGNVQFDSVVWGVELTAGGYTLSGSGNAGGIQAIAAAGGLPPEFVAGIPDNVDFDVSSTGYVAGLSTRLGYLVTPTVLVYGSAGINAFLGTDGLDVTYIDPISGVEQTENIGFDVDGDLFFGNIYGSIGAGVEFAVTDRFTLDFEYRHGFSAAGLLESEVPELENFSTSANTFTVQALFHF